MNLCFSCGKIKLQFNAKYFGQFFLLKHGCKLSDVKFRKLANFVDQSRLRDRNRDVVCGAFFHGLYDNRFRGIGFGSFDSNAFSLQLGAEDI